MKMIWIGCKDTYDRWECIAKLTSNCQNLSEIMMQTIVDFPGTMPDHNCES